MIRLAVCDDQQEYAAQVETVIKRCFREQGIASEILRYTDSRMLIYDIQENEHFDIFCLDIEMPGMSGMELAAEIRKRLPEALIMFITSHTQYAIKAYELSIFRYIPKSELETCLTMALTDGFRLLSLKDRDCYLIESPKKLQKSPLDDILYICKRQKYAVFVTRTGETSVRKPLSQILEELNREEFLMIERGYIVNLFHVIKMEENRVLIRSGEVLPVGGSYLREVRNSISEFWRKRL